MKKTKAVFTKRAIQSSNHVIYRYVEVHGKMFIHMLSQNLSTTKIRVIRSTGSLL